MWNLLLVVAELVALFFISRSVTQNIYSFLFFISRSRSFSVSLTTALLFPGTVIHELSHLFMAGALGVRTGEIKLAPESISDPEITAGSVAVEKSGPLKTALIGVAPLLTGIPALMGISYFLPNLAGEAKHMWQMGYFVRPETLYLVLALYLLFAVSNSMYASREDLKGFLPFAITVFLFGIAFYVAGLRLNATEVFNSFMNTVFATSAKNLGLVLAVNLALLLITKISVDLLRKILNIEKL